jgi:hypothetical protein
MRLLYAVLTASAVLYVFLLIETVNELLYEMSYVP